MHTNFGPFTLCWWLFVAMFYFFSFSKKKKQKKISLILQVLGQSSDNHRCFVHLSLMLSAKWQNKTSFPTTKFNLFDFYLWLLPFIGMISSANSVKSIKNSCPKQGWRDLEHARKQVWSGLHVWALSVSQCWWPMHDSDVFWPCRCSGNQVTLISQDLDV